MYTLFTDTDTDITPVEAKRFGYKLISMPYMIGDKQTYPYVDFDVFDCHSFYNSLRNGALPTTSALSPVEYIDYFEPEFKKGNDILYVHFSSAMSATFNSMRLALEELKEKYPERKVYTLDTKGITTVSYAICLEVGQMYKEGKSIEEILEWGEKEVLHFSIYFYADDLKFFHRSGRVSGFSSFFGNMFGIHPIIFMDADGTMKTFDKVRGREQSLKKLLGLVIELGDDIKNHPFVIGHTDSEELAQKFASMCKEQFGQDLETIIHPTNPTAGSHCGPDGIGVVFHSIHR